jgi:CO/xanthine dehydrogenase FAD-binding subunit
LSGERIITIEDFSIGPKQTILKSEEILTEIRIPRLKPNSETAFEKIGRTGMGLAKINTAVMLTLSKERKCENIAIAIGSCAPTILRARKAEDHLRGKRVEEDTINETASIASEETKSITDVRSTCKYRKQVSKILVTRAIQKAQKRLMDKWKSSK